jgi:hypothetical protein
MAATGPILESIVPLTGFEPRPLGLTPNNPNSLTVPGPEIRIKPVGIGRAARPASAQRRRSGGDAR